MSGRRSRWLVRFYPRAWRERYGDELADLLDNEPGLRVAIDVIRAAAAERIFNHSGLGGRMMQTYRGNVMAMAKHPSGFVPLILSAAALALLIGYVATFGTGGGMEPHHEGTAARIYQMLIGAQLLMIPWFALRWGWRDPKAGASVLALQVLAIALSFVPLWLIEH